MGKAAVTLLLFGFRYVLSAGSYTDVLPEFLLEMGGFDHEYFVIARGIVLLFLAGFLLFGLFTRMASGLLVLDAILAVLASSNSRLIVYDFGLFVLVLTIFFIGPDPWSMDKLKAIKLPPKLRKWLYYFD
jgi:uncharacterized membrane protein YphA (DoxX/SURF4 family)